MRRRLLTFLVLILAALLLTMSLQGDPGYMLLSYGRYSLETSVFVLLASLAIAIVLAKIVALILGWFNPYNWRRRSRRKD